MKKVAILVLILTLLCATALAQSAGDAVARKGECAAFLDRDGNIYISGLGEPVSATKAASLAGIDEDRILFFAQQSQGRLIALTLNGFSEAVVTDDAYAACLDGEDVYYISWANRAQLVRCDLDSGESATVFTAGAALDRVYDSRVGVIAALADGAGAYIADPLTGQFVPYGGDVARELASGDGFEAYCTDSGDLCARVDGALAPVQIDSGARTWAIVGRNVYYLSGLDGALTLKQYRVDDELWDSVLSLPADIEPQLTASQNSLFVLSSNHVIYSVDVSGKRLMNYATLPTPQSYAPDGSGQITGYRIEAVSGQLNVYGVTGKAEVQPVFEFVPSAESGSGAESEFVLLQAYPVDGENTTWDLLQAGPAQGAEGSEPQASEAPEVVPEEVPEEIPEEAGNGEIPDDGYYLPDPAVWLGNKGAPDENDKLNNMDGYYLSYVLNLEDLAAIEGYVELLKGERFGLKLRKEFEHDYASAGVVPQKFRDYCFDRRDGAVNPISVVTVDEFACDVRVGLSEYYDRGICRITIYYASAFEFIDAGDVYAGVDDIATPSKASSGDSRSSDSLFEDSKSSRKKCSRCNGHGEVDCKSCYGKGYIEQYVSAPNFSGNTHGTGKWVRKDCTNIHCRDGKVDCPYCDGGWID